EPLIERRLAARELRDVVNRRQGLWRRQGHLRRLFSQGARRWNTRSNGFTTRHGPATAFENSANPPGLICRRACSRTTSSAARTAASRTKSVRERPRNFAA